MFLRRKSHAARLAAVTLVLVATISAFGATPTVRVASAGSVHDCPTGSTASWCLGGSAGGEVDGRGGHGGQTGGPPGTGGPPSKPPPCGWETVPASVVAPWLKLPGAVENGTPPPGTQVIWQAWCFNEASGGGTYGGPYRWVATQTPQTTAAALAQQIEGTMPAPSVATDPPAGTAAVVGVPVFITVTNWQGAIVRHGTLVGVGVTVVATPTVVIDPGDGNASKQCSGAGKRYEPTAGDLWVQASQSTACTFTYGKRSGVDGRPDKWPSTVTVRWTITWSSTDGGGGAFPTVDRTVAVPRAVREVQTIVTLGE